MNKFIISFFLVLASCVSLYAQDVSGQISFYPVVFADELTPEFAKALSNKIAKIISESGYGTISYPDRFVISARTDLISNSVTPTNPPRVSKQFEVTLFVGDIVENKTFASCGMTLNGIGPTDIKAEISALNRLSSSQKDIKNMIEKSKQIIIEYYGSNSSRFVASAKDIALKGRYDEAISYLISIPPVNDICYAECQDYAVQLYQEKIDSEGYSLFSSAKAEWIADKSHSGAYKASQFLRKISPDSKCFSDAMVLWNQIDEKLDADEREAKEVAQQQYNDNLEMRKSQMDNSQTFRMAIIDACKAVGIAYGNNQPQNITKLINKWY